MKKSTVARSVPRPPPGPESRFNEALLRSLHGTVESQQSWAGFMMLNRWVSGSEILRVEKVEGRCDSGLATGWTDSFLQSQGFRWNVWIRLLGTFAELFTFCFVLFFFTSGPKSTDFTCFY